MSNRRTMLDAALSYARNGIPILPLCYPNGPHNACSCNKGANCTSPGKHPDRHLVPNGAKDASTDESVIREWLRASPKANIGGLVGPRSSIVVLDVDMHNGVDGVAELKKLEAQHGPLPPTRQHRTGGGGLHLIYTRPEACVPTTTLAPGVELRASDNQYVVLPPSVHHRGAYYKVANDAQCGQLPAWIVKSSKPIKVKAQQLPDVAVPGERHHNIISLAGASA